MPAQEGRSKRNYIAILSDETEQQRAVAESANSERRVRDYIRGLMAVLKRRDGAK
jgi:hypothetical protein